MHHLCSTIYPLNIINHSKYYTQVLKWNERNTTCRFRYNLGTGLELREFTFQQYVIHIVEVGFIIVEGNSFILRLRKPQITSVGNKIHIVMWWGSEI